MNEAPRFDQQDGEPADAVGETTEVKRVTGYSPRWNLDRALATFAIQRAAAIAAESK